MAPHAPAWRAQSCCRAPGACTVHTYTRPSLPLPRGVAEQIFFDVRIDGEAAGRIVIELLPDAPVGASRFQSLAVGQQGVDYRLSKFNGVFDVRPVRMMMGVHPLHSACPTVPLG